MGRNHLIARKVKETLICAATKYSEDHKQVIRNAVKKESVPRAKWVLENLLENYF